MARKRFEKNPEIEKKASRTAGIFCWNTANFLPGTVCPAPANLDENHIECLKLGFKMFTDIDPEIEVTVQPKYMGSRATVLIHRDRTLCQVNTRNGFRIEPKKWILEGEDEEAKERELARMAAIHSAIDDQYAKVFGEEGWAIDTVEAVLLDCELMPWRIIGHDLIQREFVGHYDTAQREFELLEHLGFNNPAVVAKKTISAYDQARTRLDHEKEDMEDFIHQVNLFGADGPCHFKPFNVLKYIYKDGTEEVVVDNNKENFDLVGEDISATFKAKDWATDEGLEKLFEFIIDNELEGFVIKPAYYPAEPCGLPPYIKVRNTEYLRIIYGPSYDRDVSKKKLVNGKKIGPKLSASIKQYRMGRDLLAFPYATLSPDNDAFYKKVRDYLVDVFYSEEECDDRL